MDNEEYSQFFILFQSHYGMYQLDEERIYTLVLKSGYLKDLDFDYYTDMFREKYKVNFYLALMVQINVDDDTTFYEINTNLKNYFNNNMNQYLVSSKNPGVWRISKDDIQQIVYEHFLLNIYEIQSTEGIWKPDFDSTTNWFLK